MLTHFLIVIKTVDQIFILIIKKEVVCRIFKHVNILNRFINLLIN